LDVVVADNCEDEDVPAPRDSTPNSRSGALPLDDEDVEPEPLLFWLDLFDRRAAGGVAVTVATAMMRGLVAGAEVARWVVVRRCVGDSGLVAGRSAFTIGGSGSSAVATQ
jgi:hypothetical protein